MKIIFILCAHAYAGPYFGMDAFDDFIFNCDRRFWEWTRSALAS
jgi:hypothetical protein